MIKITIINILIPFIPLPLNSSKGEVMMTPPMSNITALNFDPLVPCWLLAKAMAGRLILRCLMLNKLMFGNLWKYLDISVYCCHCHQGLQKKKRTYYPPQCWSFKKIPIKHILLTPPVLTFKNLLYFLDILENFQVFVC